MSRLCRNLLISFLVVAILAGFGKVRAEGPKNLFKVASLAPEGSIWAKRFNEFSQEVLNETKGEAGFRSYPGGVMGDDRAMFRKLKIGQLQGGGFTMTGIGEMVPDFRVMGIPFLFNSYDEVDRVLTRLWPRLQAAFAEKDLVLLAVSEVGFLYTMSTSPLTTEEDFRKSKCWAPEGDPISNAYLEMIGVTPIQLAIPDVLTALQTGLIDTVFNGFYGSIVLQWFTRIKYITDIPFAYNYGAIVLDKSSFSRLSPEGAAVVLKSAKKYFGMLVQDTRKSNEEALIALQKQGITMVPATEEATLAFKAQRDKTVAKIIGNAFSLEIYEETMAVLGNNRGRE